MGCHTRPWEVVGADTFTIKNNTLLCIVNYHSKFPVGKKADGFLTDVIRANVKGLMIDVTLVQRVLNNSCSID